MSAFTPISLRSLQLRNRFIKTATYEGMCYKGMPTQQLIDHHARIAQGGVALTTVAYGATDTIFKQIHFLLSPLERNNHEHNLLTARTTLGDETFNRLWAEGKAMTLEEAVEYALAV